ncbi:DoxX family protein [Deinococcus sp. 14RED07]|uniref:DoxX family protein n=1 Tax=Deinococcus sp. 14RED07 TaxID=2745874 RepID=UPI001E3224D4|nr:DoxX family protein [Deinococcus sp. 14RED07]MCD0175864.1 DoxX family protein [Deinococcus sp. 14RED07]
MTTTTPTGTRHTDLALLTVRLATGLIFVMHGAQKIFTYTLPGTTQAFTQMGAPLPALSAPLVAGAELIGGLLLIAGVLTRWAGGALTLIMLGAIALVHLKAGFFNPNGVEFPLSLLAATVALTLAGPGRYRVPGLPA